MAKIIYALSGQGLGHRSRALLIGRYLLEQGHDVIFGASGEAFPYVSKSFPGRTCKISGFYFLYRHGGLLGGKTMFENACSFPKNLARNLRVFDTVYKPFAPDMLITDYEPFSAWWAFLTGLPYISLDHQHLLTMCRLEHNLRDVFSRLPATLITKFYYVGARRYLILNFFKAAMTQKNALLVPPIVRSVVMEQEVSEGDHILYYSTDKTYHPERLPDIFNHFPAYRFRVYGFELDRVEGNCEFKSFSTDSFVRDLAGSKAVIATAGFTLISECLYLKKRMLLLPIHRQYEQIINANYIEKLGLGMSTYKLDREVLGSFLKRLDEPVQGGEQILWPDNAAFFKQFDLVLNELVSPRAANRFEQAWSKNQTD